MALKGALLASSEREGDGNDTDERLCLGLEMLGPYQINERDCLCQLCECRRGSLISVGTTLLCDSGLSCRTLENIQGQRRHSPDIRLQ